MEYNEMKEILTNWSEKILSYSRSVLDTIHAYVEYSDSKSVGEPSNYWASILQNRKWKYFDSRKGVEMEKSIDKFPIEEWIYDRRNEMDKLIEQKKFINHTYNTIYKKSSDVVSKSLNKVGDEIDNREYLLGKEIYDSEIYILNSSWLGAEWHFHNILKEEPDILKSIDSEKITMPTNRQRKPRENKRVTSIELAIFIHKLMRSELLTTDNYKWIAESMGPLFGFSGKQLQNNLSQVSPKPTQKQTGNLKKIFMEITDSL